MEIYLLNADYTYLNVLSMPAVFRLYFLERIEVIVWSDELIHTPRTTYKIPHIVRLKKMIKGMFNKGIKFKSKHVFIRDNYTCQYCEKPNLSGKDLTIDHVKPKSRGGKNTFQNTVTSCFKCNNYKADKKLDECGMMFYKKGWEPYHPTFIQFLKKDPNYNRVYDKLTELGVF